MHLKDWHRCHWQVAQIQRNIKENGASPKDTRVDVMDRMASGYNYVTAKGVG